jgi:hypothetical protein|tara:strand:+ start:500 stop:652 length:153 start_codon:yes stop_codon:yes gene_type:complete
MEEVDCRSVILTPPENIRIRSLVNVRFERCKETKDEEHAVSIHMLGPVKL